MTITDKRNQEFEFQCVLLQKHADLFNSYKDSEAFKSGSVRWSNYFNGQVQFVAFDKRAGKYAIQRAKLRAHIYGEDM